MGVEVITVPGIMGIRAADSLGGFPPVAGEFTGDINGGQASLSVAQFPSIPSRHQPAVNTAAVITYAAAPDERHRLTMLTYSYNAAPTGGVLTVTDGATGVFGMDIVAAGPGSVPLPAGGIIGTVNTAMTITLGAAGAAVTGKLSCARMTG
jgi:hypothetical protein